MVERTKSQLEEFEGKVVSVKVEESEVNGEKGNQIHIEIEPTDPEMCKGSETGKMHTWVRLSPKATESSVPEGSVADKYVQKIEAIHSEAKSTQVVLDVFNMLLDGTYLFRTEKLGKSFEGHEATAYWIPINKV